MKQINRDGPRILGESALPARLGFRELEAALEARRPVVDTRPAWEFALGAVPGTLNIPANRSFTTWAGSLLPYDRDFVLIVRDDAGTGVPELARQLAGIGLDRLAGYFGPEVFDAWTAARGPLDAIPAVERRDLAAAAAADRITALDVRSPAEWSAGHLPDALNIPLGDLERRLDEIPRGRPIVVYCQSGARAGMAAALLRAHGVPEVGVYGGGFGEWNAR